MINEVEIQKAFLNTINASAGEFRKALGKPSEELTDYMKKHQLNNPKYREEVAWHVQGLLENSLYKHGSYDNFPEIVQPVVEKWNAENEYKLSYEALEEHLPRLFKTPNSRKAFVELCEGDVESYKAFAKYPDIFMDYLIRAIVVSNLTSRNGIKSVATKVFYSFFKGNANKEYENSLKRLNLLSEGRPNEDKSKPVFITFKKAVRYGQVMRELEQPFIKGFDTIFKQVIEMDPNVLKENTYGNFFRRYNSRELAQTATQVQMFEEENEIDDLNILNENIPVSANVEEVLSLKENAPIAVSPVEVEVEVEVASFSDEETVFLSKFDETIARLQAQKAEAAAIFTNQSQNVDITQYEERLKIAGDDIHRLERAIEDEREKSKTIEENSYKKLIDAIAGAGSNFLLSDLYRESIDEGNHSREIVQGQLMNLFNQFNMAIGLDVYANGHQIGDEFDVARPDLAHDYSVLNEVQTKGDKIRVKLLQYGWTLNGKVIVQPLIQELEGAY